eukprot:6180226-Pleurochrysis_carterae.AAC.4
MLKNFSQPMSEPKPASLVGDDARVAVRDVGKGAAVHERGRALERLHSRRLQRVHQQHRQRPRDAKVVRVERLTRLGEACNHASEARAQVLEVGRQREYRHDLGGDGDGEGRRPAERLARLLVHLGCTVTNVHLSEEAVVRVGDAPPRDGGRVNVQLDEPLNLRAANQKT